VSVSDNVSLSETRGIAMSVEQPPAKIIIVDDDVRLRGLLQRFLEEQGFQVKTVEDARQMNKAFDRELYSLMVLDLMLPGGDGLQVLEELKRMNKQDGVIIISAKDALDDKIKGLKLGADDYLAKPFHLSELGARLYSILRRKQFNSSNKVAIHELEIDLWAKSVTVNQLPLVLTKKEYDLLLFFVGNKNRIISKSALAEHLSGDMADMLDNHSFVYAHVKNLKKKLADAGCQEFIKTVYGMGYKWES